MQLDQLKRREFITLLGGAAVAWPLAARAQQPDRMRRIGVLVNLPADDPQAQVRNAALLQGLQELGWTVGRNVRIDFRWGAGNAERIRRDAAELVALAPDVLLAPGTSTLEPLLQATRVVPIVFVHVADPVGGGVAAIARGANGGLIVPAGGWAVRHRDLIIARAGQHKLPAVYYDRYFVTAGGLISYGPDLVDQYRQAAGYIDRILKGEKPADLPVQTPTKYQIVLNLKAAKALGLDVPATLLARADEVIE